MVGYTDESGVTLPPLHPRCRCTIIYDEIGTPQADKPLTSPATGGNVAPTAVAPVTPAIVGTGVALPPTKPTKPNITEETIRAKLELAKAELKIKGELIYPPPKMDFTDYTFDAIHTQGDKHPHDVTEEEARRFISEAYFAIIRNKTSFNYFSREGAAYVRIDMKKIRTAFRKDEYAPPYKKLVEVYEDARGIL